VRTLVKAGELKTKGWNSSHPCVNKKFGISHTKMSADVYTCRFCSLTRDNGTAARSLINLQAQFSISSVKGLY
jgi:hypothetical protein